MNGPPPSRRPVASGRLPTRLGADTYTSARSVPSSQVVTASRKLAIITPTPMAAATAIVSAALLTVCK